MNMPSGANASAVVNQDDAVETKWVNSPYIRLLLVDDDELFREALSANLIDQQFDVVTCANGKACLDVLQHDTQFDLILLDWRMPEMSGIEVMQEIKAVNIDIPAVFLTAFATERNEVMALDCGALDFLDKSRSSAVLARRIRILVSNGNRVMGQDSGCPEIMTLGRLAIHFQVSRAFWDEELVPLTTTEFRVVQLLASRAGEDVSYRAIYDVVHGRGFIAGDGPDGHRTNVRSLIKRIRQKFRQLDPDFEEIENYPGFGYHWRQSDAHQFVDGHAVDMAPSVTKKAVSSLSQFLFKQPVTYRRQPTDKNGNRQAGPVIADPLDDAAGIVLAPVKTPNTAVERGANRQPQVGHKPGDPDTA